MATLAPSDGSPVVGSFAWHLQNLQGGNQGAENSPVKDLGAGAAPTSDGASSPGPTQTTGTAAAGGDTQQEPQGNLVTPLQAGSIIDRLFNPAQDTVNQVKTGLGGAVSDFSNIAGPSRNWAGIGGEQTLTKAIQTGAPADLDPAKALLGAQYGGPAGLDPDSLGKVQDLLGVAQNTAKAFGGGVGVSSLVTSAIPGLTSGEARMQAQRLMADPIFASRRDAYTSAADAEAKATEQAAQEASAFATQRTGEEKSIADAAKAFLTGQRDTMNAGWQQSIDADAAQRKIVQDMYQKYLDTGAAPPEVLEQVQGLQPVQQAREAQTKWNSIMDDPRYASIKNLPLLQMGSSKRYKVNELVPQEWQDSEAGKAAMQQDNWGAQQDLMEQRQRDLDKWFSPTLVDGLTDADRADPLLKQWIQEDGRLTEGPYSKFKPLYFGGDTNLTDADVPTWKEPTDVRSFVDLDPGLAANRGNVSTEEQRQMYGRIEQLLGDADSVAASDPIRAATMKLQASVLSDALQKNLDEWNTTPTEEAGAWKAELQKMRDKYNDQKINFNPFDFSNYSKGISNYSKHMTDPDVALATLIPFVGPLVGPGIASAKEAGAGQGKARPPTDSKTLTPASDIYGMGVYDKDGNRKVVR